jgi:hypothetical protein
VRYADAVGWILHCFVLAQVATEASLSLVWEILGIRGDVVETLCHWVNGTRRDAKLLVKEMNSNTNVEEEERSQHSAWDAV